MGTPLPQRCVHHLKNLLKLSMGLPSLLTKSPPSDGHWIASYRGGISHLDSVRDVLCIPKLSPASQGETREIVGKVSPKSRSLDPLPILLLRAWRYFYLQLQPLPIIVPSGHLPSFLQSANVRPLLRMVPWILMERLPICAKPSTLVQG